MSWNLCELMVWVSVALIAGFLIGFEMGAAL